jgi:hypothetical protein
VECSRSGGQRQKDDQKMPAAEEQQSPWASSERRPHFFNVLMEEAPGE